MQESFTRSSCPKISLILAIYKVKKRALSKCSGEECSFIKWFYLRRAVACFNTDGIVGSSGTGSGPKHKTETNNWERNKMRRFGN
ncbi:hypothetical protein H5410_018721 [Solanum commersonii]|uniref:Uncharacterized protein n=1 Tax=Solanum commersonii TaxID=4109 RepID=A0A9J6A2Y2_SOLCO|nr:hypothetical protein H5410_018721 [Solanum commersonii]